MNFPKILIGNLLTCNWLYDVYCCHGNCEMKGSFWKKNEDLNISFVRRKQVYNNLQEQMLYVDVKHMK